jgi:hypothetical protein
MRTAVAHTMARANPICNTAREIGAAMYPRRANRGTSHIVLVQKGAPERPGAILAAAKTEGL